MLDSPHTAQSQTAVCVTDSSSGVQLIDIDKSELHFKDEKIPDEIVDTLIEEGDILTCAGGFMVSVWTFTGPIGTSRLTPNYLGGGGALGAVLSASPRHN